MPPSISQRRYHLKGKRLIWVDDEPGFFKPGIIEQLKKFGRWKDMSESLGNLLKEKELMRKCLEEMFTSLQLDAISNAKIAGMIRELVELKRGEITRIDSEIKKIKISLKEGA